MAWLKIGRRTGLVGVPRMVVPPNLAYRRAFGQRLRALRERVDISQEQLALDSRIARSYLGGVERGEHNPSLDAIVRLAMALGCEPAELLPSL